MQESQTENFNYQEFSEEHIMLLRRIMRRLSILILMLFFLAGEIGYVWKTMQDAQKVTCKNNVVLTHHKPKEC